VTPSRLKELRHNAAYCRDADLDECLDEIERLQGECIVLAETGNGLQKENESILAVRTLLTLENSRLRSALEKIARFGDAMINDGSAIYDAARISREALEGK
jgi:hypothetical protein